MQNITRKKFLTDLTITVAGYSLFSCNAPGKTQSTVVPGLKLGYSAITWGGNDVQAIKDISDLGFRGIQLRSNVLKEFSSKPEALRELLQQHKLEFPMFSSGNANINTGDDEAVIKMHVNNAKFVKSLGGSNIQITNSSRPRTGAPTTEQLQQYGRLLNEIGKRTNDLGVQTNYHNHMHQLGETPQEVDIILQHCENRNVKFLLDIAHYFQGGGDPAKAIRDNKSRLSALHLKDVRPKDDGSAGYIFVELGQGKIDLPSVFRALNEIKFSGWGIVELDAVPDKSKTPVQCANITKEYLRSLNIKI